MFTHRTQRRLALCAPLLAIVLMTGAPATAETEYFVVVSSLRSDAHAQTMQQRAEQALGTSFQIAPVVTDDGRYLRVMAGPYLTRRLASSGVRDAQASGFDAAWLFASSAPQTPTAEAPQPTGSALSRALAAPAPNAQTSSSRAVREPRRWSTTRPPGEERARAERAADIQPLSVGVVPILIQQVPEGYRLHRLERE